MDINWPDLSIIRGYIKRRDKNNYKALFFVINVGHIGWLTNNNYSSRVTVILVDKAY